jgi:hypothetical protein
MRLAERNIIEYALEHGKTVRGTAALLGISSNYLSEEMRELGIPIPEVKPGPKPGTKRPPRPNLRVVSDDDDKKNEVANEEEEATDTVLEEETVSEDEEDWDDVEEDVEEDDEEDEDEDGVEDNDNDEDDVANNN